MIGHGLPDNADFGRLLRARRRALRRSAQVVAEQIDVTPSYVRSIERGDRAPAPDVAAALLGALDVDPSAGHDRPDLAFAVDGQEIVVEFKHRESAVAAALSTQVREYTEAMRAVQDRRRDAAAERVISQWLMLLTERVAAPTITAADPQSRAELLGHIVQRLAPLDQDRLRSVLEHLDRLDRTTERHRVRPQPTPRE